MDVYEFSELINNTVKSTHKEEIDLLFHIVDKLGRGYLTQDDLAAALNKDDH